MKNPLLCLALLAGCTIAATAHTTAAPADSVKARPAWRYAVGAKAGGAYTSFQGGSATSYDTRYKWGYLAGLTADLRLTEDVTLHPEVLYALQGSKFGDASRNRDLAYLHVPLLVRYHLNGGFDSNTIFLEAGPQLSMLLAARNEAKADLKSDVKPVTFSFALGAGYRLANGVSLGFRYDLGFTDVYQPLPAEVTRGRGEFQPSLKNDVLSLSVGYSLSRRK